MRFGGEFCYAPVPARFTMNRQDSLSQTRIAQCCSQARAIAATIFHPSSDKHRSSHIGKPGENTCITHASGAYLTLHRIKDMHESRPLNPFASACIISGSTSASRCMLPRSIFMQPKTAQRLAFPEYSGRYQCHSLFHPVVPFQYCRYPARRRLLPTKADAVRRGEEIQPLRLKA